MARFLLGDERGLPVARLAALTALLILAVASGVAMVSGTPEPSKPTAPISALEFSRVVREMSEPGGFFRSDNFISNETSYLHVLDLLGEHQVRGGAYIGVGPEQNFTYIAKIRPHLAVLLDIRRQAILQHLMYKAVFYLADSRRDFLSLLLSRPIDAGAPAAGADLETLLTYFWGRKVDPDYYEGNLKRIVRHIQRDCQVALSGEDVTSLGYVYAAFRDHGLDIRYRVGRGGDNNMGYTGYWDGAFPNLAQILLESDLNGQAGSFLAGDEDFRFVKEMHRSNRILLAVGDFAGPKALRAVGQLLRKRRLTVSAFYVSNVEQYLYQYNVFPDFAENVRMLPVDEKSMFIRAVAARRSQHPANVPGHRLTTVLQRVQSFLKHYDAGALANYWDLVTTDYIAADFPAREPMRSFR